jgi:preprotein translocase subunit SecE
LVEGSAEGNDMIEKFRQFLIETKGELGKITWPTREELRESTIVVIATVFVITMFIGVVDQFFNWTMKLVFGNL